MLNKLTQVHDDVIKWKHFPRYWPFVRGIHRSPVNSPHKGQWRGALMFSLIYAWMNGWVNNREVDDLRRQHAHYDVTVMVTLVHSIRQKSINRDHFCKKRTGFQRASFHINSSVQKTSSLFACVTKILAYCDPNVPWLVRSSPTRRACLSGVRSRLFDRNACT